MSFAQGFAAGSAAVERGLQLRDLKQQREKEEAYQAQLQGLADKYQMSQEAGAAYDQRAQEALSAGAPVANAVAQPQYSPEAQRAFGLGGAEPMMSPVSTPQVSGLAAGDQAGVVMGARPEAMSARAMREQAATIALGAGRFDDYLAAQEALASEDYRTQTLGLSRDRLALDQEAAAAEQAERERVAKQRKGMSLIQNKAAEGGTAEELVSLASDYGVGVNEAAEALKSFYDISESQVAAANRKIVNDIREIRSPFGIVKYYNDSAALSPGYSLKLEQNEKGQYVLQHIGDDGKVIESDTKTFGDIAEADYFLRQQAADPLTATKYIVDRDRTARAAAAKAAIENAKIAADRYSAELGLEGKIVTNISTAIDKLAEDPRWSTLEGGERDKRIEQVYTDRGLEPPATLVTMDAITDEERKVAATDNKTDVTPTQTPPTTAGLVSSAVDTRKAASDRKGLYDRSSEAYRAAYSAASPLAEDIVKRLDAGEITLADVEGIVARGVVGGLERGELSAVLDAARNWSMQQ